MGKHKSTPSGVFYKKTTKKNSKIAKKQKTRRQRRGGSSRSSGAKPSLFTQGYRRFHKLTRGVESAGKQSEIDAAAKAAAKAADLVELRKLRKDENYTEVNDIKEFKVGSTYVEFQGANEPLKKLGQFIEKKDSGEVFSGNTPISLIFDNGRLDGFYEARQSGYTDITTVHNVFKVNPVGPIDGSVKPKGGVVSGGRKRKSRKARK